jgi:hypothetical protein
MRVHHLSVLLVLGACSEQSLYSIDPINTVGELALSGRVCDAKTLNWLEGAVVYTHLLSEAGVLFQTYESYTDQDGYWVIEGLAPEQTYTIYIQHGSEVIDLFDVTMDAQDLTMEEPDCSGSTDVSVAVITGDYDQMDVVLGQLGIQNYDLINGLTGDELVQFLSVPENMAFYDAIFFPGGHLEEDVIYDTNGDNEQGVLVIQTAIRAYVEGGGMVYASDWSYDVVESIWPDQIDFLGDDSVPDAAQKGENAIVTAKLMDNGLKTAVGTEQVSVNFQLDGWPVIDRVGDGTTIYMRGDIPWREGMESYIIEDTPLLAGFSYGEGEVIFSSWLQSTNAEGDALEIIRHLLQDL